MPGYINYQKVPVVPRLPLKGRIDLTYRCNNNCRHCWLKEPSGDGPAKELTTEEIKDIVDQARAMGCRKWEISGGEPMLRPDFPELFEYVTDRSASYSLNTNGTLITPEIARLMKRKGTKMVSMYGATAGVHDHITRCPGSFDAMMKGFSMLKEAGAGFIVQIIPMKDNYHQYDDMVRLAESLSPHWRIGAPWLYLSSSGSPEKNAEIKAERLDPKEFVKLAAPDIFFAERYGFRFPGRSGLTDDRVFATCIGGRKAFHIDAFGGMSFCSQIKDPHLRYDLRSGNFKEAWEQFIPSLADKVRGGKEYLESCHSCPQRPLCHWCGVYGFLENGRYGSRVEYLCEVAKELYAYKDEWEHTRRRYFSVAGITILVESDLPFRDDTFDPKFRIFETAGPGTDILVIRHHFSLPAQDPGKPGREIYRKPPWAIYRKGGSWVYKGIFPAPDNESVHTLAVFNDDHSVGEIYHRNSEDFLKGGLHSLTMLPTDQILLARVLPEHTACMMHSSGVLLDGKGIVFVGHSGAGKSTITRMVKEKATVLCDDRNIIRKQNGGYSLHGCWSHGEIPLVSSLSAPLAAIFFLIQSEKNQIHRIVDHRDAFRHLTGCVVRPLATADWWNATTRLLEGIAQEVPSFVLEFDKSGAVVPEIQNVLQDLEGSKPEKKCPV
jgi:radical SAM protein with 4Fe4S-binding SPASM domain